MLSLLPFPPLPAILNFNSIPNSDTDSDLTNSAIGSSTDSICFVRKNYTSPVDVYTKNTVLSKLLRKLEFIPQFIGSF